MDLHYKGLVIPRALFVDVAVTSAPSPENVLVEVKSVEKLHWIHEKQLLTYLRLTGACLGLVINFNVEFLRAGVRRVVNAFPG